MTSINLPPLEHRHPANRDPSKPARLQALAVLLHEAPEMHIWLHLPLPRAADARASAWRWWHTIRMMCGHHQQLGLCLALGTEAPTAALNDSPWLCEPVRCVTVPAAAFVTNRQRFPVLPHGHREFLCSAWQLGVQVRTACRRSSRHVRAGAEGIRGAC